MELFITYLLLKNSCFRFNIYVSILSHFQEVETVAVANTTKFDLFIISYFK